MKYLPYFQQKKSESEEYWCKCEKSTILQNSSCLEISISKSIISLVFETPTKPPTFLKTTLLELGIYISSPLAPTYCPHTLKFPFPLFSPTIHEKSNNHTSLNMVSSKTAWRRVYISLKLFTVCICFHSDYISEIFFKTLENDKLSLIFKLSLKHNRC